MATLVLTTVGTALGGPIGGALGAILGQQVDGRLFGAKRQGARLGALVVQTSAYGQPIPRLFGTMRVAGTVIWATDLKEDRTKSGGGKGRPASTSYSYSASFAVALSARPVRAVRRIWADGKLLRGAAGDWKSETGFRLHPGDEAQAPDPLIAAAEAEGTPAYRGLAYAVFEDMQLADYGNRIPSLTFEVEADAAVVTLGAIADALGGGAIVGTAQAALRGYAASGDSVRGALETLARALPVSLRDDGARLVLDDRRVAAQPLPETELAAAADGRRADRQVIDRQAAGTLPDEISLTYYEPARDYQAGLQRARRGGAGRRVEAIELAAVLDADAAKTIVERRLDDSWAERTMAVAAVPWRRLDLRPGDMVALRGRRWRVSGWTLENMVLSLKLTGVRAGEVAAVAQAGRATGELDVPHGPSEIMLLDLPPLDDDAATPRLWLAAAGRSAGWRRAGVIASNDDGASWRALGSTAPAATMGHAVSRLPPGDETLIDMEGSVDIDLLNGAMHLLSCTDDALCNGANLAMLGDELIQFGRAEPLGGTRWRLSRLLRGRRGTGATMSLHGAGDPFVLIERDALLAIDAPAGRIGSRLQVIATGVGDPVGVTAAREISGRAIRPLVPVHLRAVPADGGLRFSWTRRSRAGWAWTDGGDVPLGEDSERYHVIVTSDRGSRRVAEVAEPSFLYGGGDLAADGGTGAASVLIEVSQSGTIAGSIDPARARFTIDGEPA